MIDVQEIETAIRTKRIVKQQPRVKDGTPSAYTRTGLAALLEDLIVAEIRYYECLASFASSPRGTAAYPTLLNARKRADSLFNQIGDAVLPRAAT